MEPTIRDNTNPMTQLAVIEYRIHEHMANAAGHLLGVGQCLIEAKNSGLVPHGAWEDWVLRNTGFSVRQAQRVMQVAREVPEGSVLSRLPFSKMQAVLALPGDEREQMAERVETEDMSLQELKKAIAAEKQRADGLQAALENLDPGEELRYKQAEAEDLKRKLAEADALIQAQAELVQFYDAAAKKQSELRAQAQAELLEMKTKAARGELPTAPKPEIDIADAVRVFIGSAGVLPHMGREMAAASEEQRAGILRNVEMIEEWARGTRKALDTMILGEGDWE